MLASTFHLRKTLGFLLIKLGTSSSTAKWLRVLWLSSGIIPLYDNRKSHSMRAPAQESILQRGISVAHIPAAEITMKNDPRVPERKDIEEKEFPCRSCGEKFNSLAEAEQHEKDCRNRETSGAKRAERE
jgi:hypothetical protein